MKVGARLHTLLLYRRSHIRIAPGLARADWRDGPYSPILCRLLAAPTTPMLPISITMMPLSISRRHAIMPFHFRPMIFAAAALASGATNAAGREGASPRSRCGTATSSKSSARSLARAHALALVTCRHGSIKSIPDSHYHDYTDFADYYYLPDAPRRRSSPTIPRYRLRLPRPPHTSRRRR